MDLDYVKHEKEIIQNFHFQILSFLFHDINDELVKYKSFQN